MRLAIGEEDSKPEGTEEAFALTRAIISQVIVFVPCGFVGTGNWQLATGERTAQDLA
ncbi:MAG TPA: hypothetical protein VFK20_00790 [Vicinamibacterales bacterium]|nr:hypothetical protein [Vicinamibacterales bacterium]